MNNIIQLVFDPNEIAVVKTGHMVRLYRLDNQARQQRKVRTRRKRKTSRLGSEPTAG